MKEEVYAKAEEEIWHIIISFYEFQVTLSNHVSLQKFQVLRVLLLKLQGS
jgi:hypothetical protein